MSDYYDQNDNDDLANLPKDIADTASNAINTAKNLQDLTKIAQKAANNLGKQTAKNTGEQVAKEVGKQAAKEGTKAAGRAAADAGTGGFAEIIFVALDIFTFGFKKLKQGSNYILGEDDEKSPSFIWAIFLFGILLLLYPAICGVLMLDLNPSGANEYKGTTYEKTYNKMFGLEFKQDVIEFKKSKEDDPEAFEEYYHKLPFETAIQRLIYNTKAQNLEISEVGNSVKEDNSGRIINIFSKSEEVISDKDAGTKFDIESLRGALANTVLDTMYNRFCSWSEWNRDHHEGIIERRGKEALEKAGRDDKYYQGDKTIYSLLENHYPYDLNRSPNDTFPKIGNVLKSDYWIGDYPERWHPRLDDVNYTEVLNIISQNEDFDWDKIDYVEYLKFINSEKAKFHYFEMSVKWIPVYCGKRAIGTYPDGSTEYENIEEPGDPCSSEEELANAPEEKVIKGVTCKFEKWYASVLVYPFGLTEEYMLMDVDPYADNNFFKTHVYMGEGQPEENHSHNNLQILDHAEYTFRTYERIQNREVGTAKKKTRLGPSYALLRSKLSNIYVKIAETYGEAKGRSAWRYLDDDPYNLKCLDEILEEEELQDYLNKLGKLKQQLQENNLDEFKRSNIDLKNINIDWDSLTPEQAQFLEYLLNAVEFGSYDQGNRWGQDVYDCSSLAIRAYESIGISLTGGLTGNTDTLLRHFVNTNTLKTSGDLQFGDLIFYRTSDGIKNGHLQGVGHVSIYVGNGKVVSAAGKKYGVLYQNYKSNNVIGVGSGF